MRHLTLKISVLNKASRKISLEINGPSCFGLIFSTGVLQHRLYPTNFLTLDANTHEIITVHICFGRLKKHQEIFVRIFFVFFNPIF